jgi:hypothetical protein
MFPMRLGGGPAELIIRATAVLLPSRRAAPRLM